MMLLADNKSPDLTAHMCTLIWAFTVHRCQKTHFFAWCCPLVIENCIFNAQEAETKMVNYTPLLRGRGILFLVSALVWHFLVCTISSETVVGSLPNLYG